MPGGYTLLELLIVLLLMALLTGLAAPRLMQVYDSVQTAFERDDVFSRINNLGFIAWQQGRAFMLGGSSEEESTGLPAAPLDLPTGWQVTAKVPVLYRENGVCGGGEIRLMKNDIVYTVQLTAPFCQIQS